MTRPDLATIMQRAHEVAKAECTGDYRACLAIGLRAAWAEAKGAKVIEMTETATAPSVPELPALLGSEKQIAWAEGIRRGALADLAKVEADNAAMLDRGARRHSTPADVLAGAKKKAAAAFEAARAELAAHADAAWWIDNRNVNTPLNHGQTGLAHSVLRDALKRAVAAISEAAA